MVTRVPPSRWSRLPEVLKCLVFSFSTDFEHITVLAQLDKQTRALAALPASFAPHLELVNDEELWSALPRARLEQATTRMELHNLRVDKGSHRNLSCKRVRSLSMKECHLSREVFAPAGFCDNLTDLTYVHRACNCHDSLEIESIVLFAPNLVRLHLLFRSDLGAAGTKVPFLEVDNWDQLAERLPFLEDLWIEGYQLFRNSENSTLQAGRWPWLQTLRIKAQDESEFPDMRNLTSVQMCCLSSCAQERYDRAPSFVFDKQLPPNLTTLTMCFFAVRPEDLMRQQKLQFLFLIECACASSREYLPGEIRPLPLLECGIFQSDHEPGALSALFPADSIRR